MNFSDKILRQQSCQSVPNLQLQLQVQQLRAHVDPRRVDAPKDLRLLAGELGRYCLRCRQKGRAAEAGNERGHLPQVQRRIHYKGRSEGTSGTPNSSIPMCFS